MTNLRETSVAFLKPVLVVVNKFIFILHTQSDLKHQIYRKGVTKTQTSKTQTSKTQTPDAWMYRNVRPSKKLWSLDVTKGQRWISLVMST